MAFVDGENLVKRFEAMRSGGGKPRDEIVHEPGNLVWHPGFLHQAYYARGDVLRATYYTSAIGSEHDLEKLRDRISELTFPTGPHIQGPWPNRLSPEVFRRDKGTQRSKGVDIKMTIDVLTQVWQDNVDTVLLLAGDGDYVPLVAEIVRAGKLAMIAAFSSGLSPALARAASDFFILDHAAFAS